MITAGDLVMKAVGVFVADGIKRAYQEVKGGIKRRQILDKALSGVSDADDARLQRAFNDLAILIGNSRGVLTENVAAFLREVEKSAIPEAIIRCALTGGDIRLIYPAFELIYGSFTELPFPCQNFFDAFCAAIKLSLEAEVKDPTLLEFIQAQHGEITRQLADVSRALSASRQLATTLSSQEVLDSRARLARSLEVANRYLSVETLKGVKRCRIRQLVVPPRLATSQTTKVELRKARTQPKETDHISYLSFKSSVRRAVILGDPGGGKSTLTQLLCYDNSNSIILDANFKPQIDATSLRIPLRIVLRSFDKRRQASASHGLLDHLIEQTKEVFDSDVAFTSKILRHFLTLGSAVLVFDGLDEILEVDRRRQIVTLIEQFSGNYAACPSIITSRLVGYQDAPMSEDYSVYYLSTFNNEEVRSFSHKFIQFIEGIKSRLAKEKSDKFLAQTNNVAADLRENPLMLGLMVYLFVYRGDVPANRPEIYKECATLMFEKWDQRRDIIFKIPVDFDLLDLFSFLASKIFGSATNEDGVSRDWIVAELRAYFESWYVDKAKALHAAKSLVDFITGRAWVMFEVGPNVYKFTHRTFLEYFFARNLISSSESVAALFRSNLLDKILKSEWDVVCHLAMQTAVFRDSGKMMQAADVIMSTMSEGRAPRDELALLRFVANTLDYLLLPETRYCEMVRLICERTIEIGSETGAIAVSVLDLVIRNTRKRETLAKAVIYRSLRQAILGRDQYKRWFGMFATASAPIVDAYFRYPHIGPGLTPSWTLARSNGPYFQELRKETDQTNWSLAEKSAVDARIYLFTYNDRHLDLFSRHGWDAFLATTSRPVLDDLPNAIIETLEYYVLSDDNAFHSLKVTKNPDDRWLLINKMVDDILAHHAPVQILSKSFHEFELESKLDLLLRGIFSKLCTKKAKADHPRYIKLFYLLAFVIENLEKVRPPKKGGAKQGRLEPFFSFNVLERMSGALNSDPLGLAILDWNLRKTTLVGHASS